MEKINIAELLKDCPKGMELDCTIYSNVTFIGIYKGVFPTIKVQTEEGVMHLTECGCYAKCETAKCVIFPKGKTTWEGFVPPCKFKDGDVVVNQNNIGTWIGIYQRHDYLYEAFFSYCYIRRDGEFCASSGSGHGYFGTRFATDEEKQKLFDAIKANGYRWDEETKKLEKLVEPKFHVGDWVTDGVSKCQICFINDTQYWYAENCILGSIETVDKQYHLWNINKDAKDGDVLFHSDSASNGIFIFKEMSQRGTIQKVICYCDYDSEDGFCLGENHTCCWTDSKILHPATKEQCNLLFQKIKEAGYKWNAETKTLEKLIEPKFKVGDVIVHCERGGKKFTIDGVYKTQYGVKELDFGIPIETQDEYELDPNKFDINTLEAFEGKVLVRNEDNDEWRGQFFSHYDIYDCVRPYVCIGVEGLCEYKQCIPFECNEHLLGKTDDCDEYYKSWE